MSLDVNISEPDEFNNSDLHSCIDEVAKINGVENFTYHVDFIHGKGIHYTANIFKVNIKNTDNDKQYKYVIKTLINTSRQELYHELHKREVESYAKVLNEFEDIQKLVDVKDRIVFPKCVYSRTEKCEEVIILEDMVETGFQIDDTLSMYERLSHGQVNAAIESLAKFHALSFIYEKQHPDKYLELKNEFRDIIFSKSFLNKTKLRSYFDDSFGTALALVENLEAKHKLEIIKTKLLDILRYYVKPDELSVLCHGDFWMNNLMFNDTEPKPQVCLIDFQTLRYSSPITDIVHFLYICTDSAYRSVYFQELLNQYYATLESFLNLYGVDVNFVCNREHFDQEVKKVKPLGLLVALINLKIVTSEVNDIDESGRTSNFRESDDYYRLRVNDVVNECLDSGVIDELVDLVNKINE